MLEPNQEDLTISAGLSTNLLYEHLSSTFDQSIGVDWE
jgi:hypothetical protein